MSIAEHRQAAAQGGPRTRWALGCLLAASITATAAAGAGCGQRNLAVITLEGQTSSATALTAYYRLNGGEWKTVEPVHSLQQFGLELPKEHSATLETQIFSYAKSMPCILGSAAGSTDLDGSSIRELQLPVTTTTDRCHTTAEPADFPQGKTIVWANAANDIWLAGTGGKVVHWDGSTYTKVPLPADLEGTPPDWLTILGNMDGIWLAGTNGAFVRYANGALTSVKKLSSGATEWRSMGLLSPQNILLAGTNKIIGIASAAAGVAQQPFSCGTPGELTAVNCPLDGGSGRCFFVTDKGGIASAQINLAGNPQCKNITSPTTKGLLDVFVGVNSSAAPVYDVRIVGTAGVALRGTTPISSLNDPSFTAANTDYSSFVPQSARVDLNRISGTSVDELWVVGPGGLLMRWNNTPVGMAPVMPFTLSQSGTTADLFSISEFASNLFFSGANHTLGYLGPMFTAN